MPFQLIDTSSGVTSGVLTITDSTSGTSTNLGMGVGCTLETDDVILVVHTNERRGDSSNGPRAVPLSNNGLHTSGWPAPTVASGGTSYTWTWTDVGYASAGRNNDDPNGGEDAEVGCGAWLYKVTASDPKTNVLITARNQTGANSTGGRGKMAARIMVFRGIDLSGLLQGVVSIAVCGASSREPTSNIGNHDSSRTQVEWVPPSNTTYWNSSNFDGEIAGLYIGTFERTSGINPGGESGSDSVTTTDDANWHQGEADTSTTESTTPAGFSTTNSGHRQIFVAMKYANFTAADFTNRAIDRQNNGNTLSQCSIFIPLPIAATSENRTVTPGTASIGTVTATADVAGAQPRSVIVGTHSLGEVTATASVSSAQTVNIDVPTSSVGEVTSTASVTAVQTRSVQVPTSSLEELTATASVASAQTVSVQVPTSSVGEVTATASVSASQQVGVSTGTVSITAVTGTASVSASQDVGINTATTSIGEVTATASVSAGQQRSVQVPSSSVGEVTATASVTAAQTVDIETSVSIGEVTGTASVSASQDVGVNVPTSSIGTVTATATVVTSAEGEVVPGTSSVGEVTATASVTAGQARGINVPTSSIGVVTGTADADASQDVGINVPASSVIGFSATAGVSSTSVVTIETSTSFGQVSATASVQIAVPDHVLSVTIDGVGDIVENLLTRSEIVAIEEIWNTGLTQLGVGRVDSATDDNSAQAALLRAVWPNFRKQFISDHAWNGCKTTAQLTALPDSDFKDTTRWSNIFSLPSDYIRALTVNGHRNQPDNSESVMWEIEVVANSSGAKSRCLCTNQSTAKLEYVFDVGDSVELLAPAMKHAMGLAFGAFVAPNFGKSANEIALLEQKVKENLLKARGIDGQENSARYFSPSELVESRYRSL